MKTKVTPLTIGLIVRDARDRVAMTQQDLATKAGVSRRWLSDFENGKATAELGKVLAVLSALNLPLYVDYPAANEDGH